MRSNNPLNIIFAGTPEFSAQILQSILDQGHSITAVYCQPDRRVGRGKKMAFGPVKSLAIEKGIAVEQPIKFNSEPDQQGLTPIAKLRSYQPDLMIVVAYGLILPEDVLSVPTFGCVNIHASVLPRWRGAAPIQRVIESGDKRTGITIMQMDKGLDTGNMLSIEHCDISDNDTGSTLHDKLAVIACQQINQFLANFSPSNGSPLSPGIVQNDDNATYAHKLTKKEAEIDWSETASNIEKKIRAFNSWPVCFTYVGNNRLRIWQASVQKFPDGKERTSKPGNILLVTKAEILVACGSNTALSLERIQADGSREMSVAELLNSKNQWFIDYPQLGRI